MPPYRVWIAAMIFMTTFTNYMLRANMSVSIISMVGKKSKNFVPPCKRGEHTTESSKTAVNISTTESSKDKDEGDDKKYDWSETEVGNIIGAYFWGYLITVVPGGTLSELLGPWHVILWSSIGCAIFTGLTPISANFGSIGVMVNRFIIGMLGGVVYPAVNVLIAKWAPPKEKGKFMAMMMGNTLGTVVSFNLVGLATSAWGWPWGFYVLVIVMVAYCLAFALLVADTPDKCRWVSEAERTHIFESQGGHVSKKKAVAPYRRMLLSYRFWALCAAQFGNLWGLNLILTYAPKFMAQTLGFNIKASAGLAALPYLARLITSQIFGTIGDLMRKKEVMSVTKIRKFFIIFSHFLPAACLFLIRVAGCNHAGVIVLLVLNQGLNGAVVVGHLINPQDLTPNFAGSCYGVMNFIGMSTGIIVPPITAALNTHYNMELIAATIIYMIGGIVFAACGVVFILFGTAEVQPWNEVKEDPSAE